MPTIFLTNFSGGQSKFNRKGLKFPPLSDIFRDTEFWRNSQCWVFNEDQLNKITPTFTLSQLNISTSVLNDRPYAVESSAPLVAVYPNSRWAIQLLNFRLLLLNSDYTATDYLNDKGGGTLLVGPYENFVGFSTPCLYYKRGSNVRRLYVNTSYQIVDEYVLDLEFGYLNASFSTFGPNNGLYFASNRSISVHYPSTQTNRSNFIRTNVEIKGTVYWNGFLVYATNQGNVYFWNGFDDYTSLLPYKIPERYILSLFIFQNNLYIFAFTNYVYSLYVFTGKQFEKIFETKEDWKLARWGEDTSTSQWNVVSNTNFYQIAILPNYFLFSTETAIWAFGRPHEGADYGLFKVFELTSDMEHPSCLQVLPNTNNVVFVGMYQKAYLINFETFPSYFWLVSNPIDFQRPTKINRMKLYFSYIPQNSVYEVKLYLKKPGETVGLNEPPFYSFTTDKIDNKKEVLINRSYIAKNDVFLYIEFNRTSGDEIIGFKGLGIEYQALDTL